VLKADRYEEKEKFGRMLNQSGAWEVVVDETAFHENFIHDVVTAFAIPGRHKNDPSGGFRFKHYIYLSSDSIYWQLKMPDDDNPVNESSPRRFHPDEEKPHRKYLKQTDQGQYHAGHAKDQMTCDVFLHQVFTAYGFPYTSLRLPDVYGPYNQDTEHGFWNIVHTVQEGRKLAAKYPPGRIRPRGSRQALEDHSKFKATWAFVGDVADAIVAVIKAGREHELPIGEQYKKEGPFGEVFHIGHEEAVSLEEFSNIIFNVGKESPVVSGQFGASGAVLDYEEEALHPATDFGALDVSKAKHYLKWEPTPIREAVQVSLEWYFGEQQSLPGDIARHKEL
jgi:nucleoside-diphosphate-sugar epimerase